MPRTAKEIREELNALYTQDEQMRQGTPEYQELRGRIKKLISELAAATPITPAPMTVENYHHSPDSFGQAALNRKRGRR